MAYILVDSDGTVWAVLHTEEEAKKFSTRYSIPLRVECCEWVQAIERFSAESGYRFTALAAVP